MKVEDCDLIVKAWGKHEAECARCHAAVRRSDLVPHYDYCPIGLKILHQWQLLIPYQTDRSVR